MVRLPLSQALGPDLAEQKPRGEPSRIRKVGRLNQCLEYSLQNQVAKLLFNAVPRPDHAPMKAREQASEDPGSDSEEDFSDSEDEGTDGYKKGTPQHSMPA